MNSSARQCAVLALALASPAFVCAQEPAYRLEAVYTGEAWRNTHGGLRIGSSYLDNLDLTFEIDGERAWGVDSLLVFAHALYNGGGSVSADLIGDAQIASNIEAFEQVRLYELWVERAFGADRSSSIRVGLYDLNSEFDVSATSGLFTNSSHGIAPPLAHSGLNGPSIFPVTSLGARFQWHPATDWTLRLAVLDAVPGDPTEPRSNAIHLRKEEGLLLVGEVQRGGPLRKVALGSWAYTSKHEAVLPGPAATSAGMYVLAERRLLHEQGNSQQGLDGFVRAGVATDRVNRFSQFVGMGLVYTGALPGRPTDQLGIALALPRNGSPYRAAQALDSSATTARESTIELTYLAEISDHLSLQPVLQYTRDPNTDPTLGSSFAFALRFTLTGRRAW